MKMLRDALLLLVGFFVFVFIIGVVSGDKSSGSHSELCSTTNLLVKRQIPFGGKTAKSIGNCRVDGQGHIKTVNYAYTTAISRNNGSPPIYYRATVAYDGNLYYLCDVHWAGEEKREKVSHHYMCQ